MKIFKEKLFAVFPPAKTTHSKASNLYDLSLYRGFYLHDDNEITMVFDATYIELPVTTSYKWVTPYEIFTLRTLGTVPIERHVEKMFNEMGSSGDQREFYHLKEAYSDTVLKSPYVLFMCKKEQQSSDTGFLLVDMIKGESSNEVYKTIEDIDNYVIYPRMRNEKIGTYYFFTSKPIGRKSQVQRFVCFIDDDGLKPKFVEPSENDTLDSLYDYDKESFTSITFIENDIQLWAIKSSAHFCLIENNDENLVAEVIDEEESLIE